MNKSIIYLVVLIILASGVFAIGIGARNEQIVAGGKKTVELFIINSEHENTEVRIGVLGDGKGIVILPDLINLQQNDDMKKFMVTLDFDKIKNHSVKIFASEIIENGGQIAASANIVYLIPIIEPEITNEIAQKIQTSPLIASSYMLEKPADNAQPFIENQNASLSQLSGAASKNKMVFDMVMDKKDEIKLISAGIFITAFIISLNVFFAKRKTPLEKYIIKSRGDGKSDDEIRNELKEAGWNDWILDRYMTK